jgi:malate dehydrogenase (oxaloacetate-decarboxylating)(NADP+)
MQPQTPKNLKRLVHPSPVADVSHAVFYKVLSTEPASFMPIAYHPKRETARVDLGNFYPKPAGVYLSIEQHGKVKEVLSNWPVIEVGFVCISVGGRIGGGDGLAGTGLGIPVSKLELGMVCDAERPAGLLPLLLDCGTDDARLLADPLYPGLKQKPPVENLDRFVAELARAAQELFPRCCVHFEDWSGVEASRLLKHYVDMLPPPRMSV